MDRQRFTIRALLAATLLLFTSTPVSTQSAENFVRVKDGALRQLPSEARIRLIERLELYIESLSNNNLENVYDLLAEDCRHGLGRDEWLQQTRLELPGRIQQFILEEVYAGNTLSPEAGRGAQWIAYGCGVYRNENGLSRYKARYSMFWLNGEWYICRSGIDIEGAEGKYIRCSDDGI